MTVGRGAVPAPARGLAPAGGAERGGEPARWPRPPRGVAGALGVAESGGRLRPPDVRGDGARGDGAAEAGAALGG